MEARVHLGQIKPHLAVFVGVIVFEQAFRHGEALVDFSFVGKLACEHQFQIAGLGIGVDGLARDFDCFVELLGVTIGIDLALVAAQRRVAAHVDHLLVSGNRLVGFVLFVVNRAQPLEEDSAIVLFFRGVRAVGVRGEIDHVLVNLGGFVVPSQHVEKETLVISGFEIIRFLLNGFADGCQGVIVFALTALDFADVNERAGVIGIGVGQLLVFLHGRVELVVVQKGLRKRAHGAHVAWFDVDGPLISGDRVLGTLHLVVCGAEGELHFAGAVGFGNGFNYFCSVLKVAALGIKTRKVQDYVLGVRLDCLCGLELLLCLLGQVFDGVQLPEDHAVFHVPRFERNNLFVFGDGLVERIPAGRGRGNGVLRFA